ncbi:MAG: RNA polymerase sigma factor [Gammaproteobacteria bacterium]|nr:RNA polymerase sigma factor [Gammaproteobacteria bacterium]MDH5651941.1 RNA polymerase sigma factor [Gammaproteobacteria bacterium]
MNIFSFNAGKSRQLGEFESLIGPHLLHLYQLAYRLTGRQTDAEDLVQDVVVKLLPRVKEMVAIEQLRPWLAKILYRKFVDHYRRNERSPVTLVPEMEELLENHIDETQFTPEADTENSLTQQHLKQALETLNQDQRTVVMLHDVEGYTLVELEVILDTPIGTLKSRLNRARGQLREYLEKK